MHPRDPAPIEIPHAPLAWTAAIHRDRLSLALSALIACTAPADTDTGATSGDHENIFTATYSRDVDLLFVVDDSATMADEQRALAAAFPALLATSTAPAARPTTASASPPTPATRAAPPPPRRLRLRRPRRPRRLVDDLAAAAVHPVARYVDRLAQVELAERDFKSDAEVLVTLVTGVPPGYATRDVELVYADVADPNLQSQFGIGPGCLVGPPDALIAAAVPPVRERALAEAFALDPAGDRNLHSACEPTTPPQRPTSAPGSATRSPLLPASLRRRHQPRHARHRRRLPGVRQGPRRRHPHPARPVRPRPDRLAGPGRRDGVLRRAVRPRRQRDPRSPICPPRASTPASTSSSGSCARVRPNPAPRCRSPASCPPTRRRTARTRDRPAVRSTPAVTIPP